MINDGGGIYGRKLVLAYDRDDQFGSNRQTVQASLAQDKAFATFIATTFFTGADLLAAKRTSRCSCGTSTTSSPATRRSSPTTPRSASRARATSGPGSPSSWRRPRSACSAYGDRRSRRTAPRASRRRSRSTRRRKVVYDDESLGFAQPLGPQVTKMKEKGVQFVLDLRRPAGVVHARQGDAEAGHERRAAAAERLRPELHRQERRAARRLDRDPAVPRLRAHAADPGDQGPLQVDGQDRREGQRAHRGRLADRRRVLHRTRGCRPRVLAGEGRRLPEHAHATTPTTASSSRSTGPRATSIRSRTPRRAATRSARTS